MSIHGVEAPMKRRDFLKSITALGAASAIPAPAVRSPARSQSRQETLLVVTEYGPNNFDIHGVGTNRPGYEVSWNCYDRLMSHGTKTLPDGTLSYDRDTFTPELAEDWNATDASITFRLRKNAKFHDGTPITAKDVKWSFDRAVSVGGFPTFQMKAGSLEKPEQFVAVDDYTFRVDLIRKDKLTMADLAVVVPAVYHSELVKKHATEKDPWGLEYTKTNIAGGGAFKVARWQAGTEVVFERYDDWKGGALPKVRRVVYVFYYLLGWAPAPLGRLDVFYSAPPPVTGFYLIDSALAGDWEVWRAASKQLVLPALTLGIFSLAPIARMTRASMLAVLASDFIRTARASGLSPFTVVFTYAFRNAMLPVVTTLGMVFSFLLGANVLVEKVFAWPGIGSYAVEALIASDFAPVQGFVLTMAAMYVGLNLAIDILYGLIDPRVRIEA
jgi:hypothetical protein